MNGDWYKNKLVFITMFLSRVKGMFWRLAVGEEILSFRFSKYAWVLYAAAYPSKTREAIGWLYQASFGGHVRAQYQLALCLHQGRGMERSLPEAVFPSIFYFTFDTHIYFFSLFSHMSLVFQSHWSSYTCVLRLFVFCFLFQIWNFLP